MSLLIFSTRCQHSKSVIEFVQKHEQLQQIVHYHDVNVRGVPEQYRHKINRVPTMLTKNGKILVGNEIINWLRSLLPSEEVEGHGFGGHFSMVGINGETIDDGSSFSLDRYGESIAPPMTPELEAKINKPVGNGVAYEQLPS